MDQTFPSLVAAWWHSDRYDDARRIAERLRRLPTDAVADLLTALRFGNLRLASEAIAEALDATAATARGKPLRN